MTSEIADKMTKLRSLSAAIGRASEVLTKHPGYKNAVTLQRLKRQRDELQATLPPFTVVAN